MAAMWIALACMVISIIGLVCENLGLFAFFGVIAAISFFVFLPISVNANEKEKNEQLLKEGKPVIIDWAVGHFYGVYETWCAGVPDSAGGWDINGTIKNIGSSTINYVDIYCYPIDHIGSRVAPTSHLHFTGPLYGHGKSPISLKHKWYDLSINCVVIEKIEIQYSSGISQTVEY